MTLESERCERYIACNGKVTVRIPTGTRANCRFHQTLDMSRTQDQTARKEGWIQSGGVNARKSGSDELWGTDRSG